MTKKKNPSYTAQFTTYPGQNFSSVKENSIKFKTTYYFGKSGRYNRTRCPLNGVY